MCKGCCMRRVFVGGASRRAQRRARRTEYKLAIVPLLVAGEDEARLRARAEQLRAHLVEHPALELADVAFSLASARTQSGERGAVLGADREALLAGLAALAG